MPSGYRPTQKGLKTNTQSDSQAKQRQSSIGRGSYRGQRFSSMSLRVSPRAAADNAQPREAQLERGHQTIAITFLVLLPAALEEEAALQAHGPADARDELQHVFHHRHHATGACQQDNTTTRSIRIQVVIWAGACADAPMSSARDTIEQPAAKSRPAAWLPAHTHAHARATSSPQHQRKAEKTDTRRTDEDAAFRLGNQIARETEGNVVVHLRGEREQEPPNEQETQLRNCERAWTSPALP